MKSTCPLVIDVDAAAVVEVVVSAVVANGNSVVVVELAVSAAVVELAVSAADVDSKVAKIASAGVVVDVVSSALAGVADNTKHTMKATTVAVVLPDSCSNLCARSDVKFDSKWKKIGMGLTLCGTEPK